MPGQPIADAGFVAHERGFEAVEPSVGVFDHDAVAVKFGGMSVSELQRLKHLEDENRRLKQLYAELSLEHQVMKEVLRKK